MLVLGLATAGAGATLGAAQLARGTDAAEIQYGHEIADEGGEGEVRDESGSGHAPRDPGEDAVRTPPIREADQLATAGPGSLPFTGAVLPPLLAVGLILTAAGVAMWRRREPSA